MQCLVLPRSEEEHEEVIESLSLDHPMKSDDRSAIVLVRFVEVESGRLLSRQVGDVRFFSFEWIFSELS